MKYLPNALTCSRLFFAAGLVWAMLDGHGLAATLFLIIGLSTDVLDGWAARHFHAESSFGGNFLDPACDLVLAVTAITMLIVGGVWPVWVGVGLFVIWALLQLISSFRKVSWVKPLKQVQHWLHPGYSILVMYLVVLTYIVNYAEAPWRAILPVSVSAAILAVGYSRRRRIAAMFHYQED